MGGNSNSGKKFKIKALNDIVLDGIQGFPEYFGYRVEVYYRAGSYIGYELSSNGWTLIGKAYASYNSNIGISTVPLHLNFPI